MDKIKEIIIKALSLGGIVGKVLNGIVYYIVAYTFASILTEPFLFLAELLSKIIALLR
jgi:hypothetical protein